MLPPPSFWVFCQQGNRLRTAQVFGRGSIGAVFVFMNTFLCGHCCSQPGLWLLLHILCFSSLWSSQLVPFGLGFWRETPLGSAAPGRVQSKSAGLEWPGGGGGAAQGEAGAALACSLCSSAQPLAQLPLNEVLKYHKHGSVCSCPTEMMHRQRFIWRALKCHSYRFHSVLLSPSDSLQFFPLTLVLHDLEMGLLGCSQGTHCTSTNLINPARENGCHEQFLP